LEDRAVVRELEVGFFQHGVVVVSGDDVARSTSCFCSGSIGVAGYCVRVCFLNEIMEVVSLFLRVFIWGHNKLRSRLSTALVRSLSKHLGMLRSAMKSLLIVVCAWVVPLVLGAIPGTSHRIPEVCKLP
jgi:hypothetical protein